MAATLPFHEALNKGIVSGTLVDTKIILFSRRDSSGRVCGPKALYASSHVLKSVPYFNDLLFGNFSEAELRDLNDDIGNNGFVAEDYGYCSDSDLEDDEDENPNQPARTRDKSSARPSRKPHCSVLKEPRHGSHTELANEGKIVRIPDMAFVTFQAFIFYLYTGQIEFSPRGSKENRISGQTGVQIPLNHTIPRPSSKSIYRLADKYDVPALKDLALNHIRGGLKGCDIVEETFSEFTSRYDDIKMACIPHLVSALRSDTAERTTWMRLCEVIEGHFKGDLQHVTDTLSLLWKTVSQDDEPAMTTTSSGARSAVSAHVDNSTGSTILQSAIVKSVREGVFFDRKYWARSSSKGSVSKAVYFSSMFTSSELEACVTHSSSKTSPTKDSMGETNAESDCESDSIKTEGEVEVGNEEMCALLSPGSHSAWRSFFFYQFTGRISFAPLRSQGAEYRLVYIFKKTRVDAPPPCSPKSIYIIAKTLNIPPLCDLAFKDIESKLSASNIVEEFFSPISARNTQVLEMECRLLFSKFKNPTTMSLVQEKIGGTSVNQFAYRADAFKLGLQTALNLKGRDPPAGMMEAVTLRCRHIDCPGHNEHIPYAAVVSRCGFCPRCNFNRVQCVGCGYVQMNENPWCESCRKSFL